PCRPARWPAPTMDRCRSSGSTPPGRTRTARPLAPLRRRCRGGIRVSLPFPSWRGCPFWVGKWFASCLRNGFLAEHVQHKLRPGFELIPLALEFRDRGEAGPRERLLAPPDLRLGQVEEVHDTQVDLSDGRGVVVDQAQAALLETGFQVDFLRHLAEHRL